MGKGVARSASVLLGLLVLSAGCGGTTTPQRFGRETEVWQRMLAAEDGRIPSPEALDALAEGLRTTDPQLWLWSVRGLGRLEDEAALPTILPALTAPSAAVRREAVNAAGQAVVRGDPTPARNALLARLAEESDPMVRGAIAATLGRMRHEDPGGVRATVALLSDVAGIRPGLSGPGDGATRELVTWLGVARGFFFLVRQPAARAAMPEQAATTIRELLTAESDADPRTAAHVRRLAGAALAASGRITAADIDALLADDSAMVRREGAAAIAGVTDRAVAAELAERAIGDDDARVRIEAVRAVPRAFDPARACDRLLGRVPDPSPHVSLLAIDQIGSSCAGHPAAVAILDSLMRGLPAGTDASWHRAAHALVALARVAGPRAAAGLPQFASHENAFVRAWAARAARLLEDTSLLLGLSRDASPNVRTAAVEGLHALVGHDADTVYVAQLAHDDSQLLQAAAIALEGGDAAALPALLEAFDRVSAAGRETWRDSRRALLTRIREHGDAAAADRVRPYLTDYDAEIAALAAAVLDDWTGERPEARPVPAPRLDLPDLADLEALDSADVVIEMADGGVITLRLFPFIAPTNAWRFARLARAGYYDGLTFHRVAPNFVIQGGSPAANEYAGDGPFTRDEVSMMSNTRGTVGLSTRGRDTGDAQFYINLIDNTRLDHDYTVFAQVVSGMDVVDRVLEGAVMRRVSVGER